MFQPKKIILTYYSPKDKVVENLLRFGNVEIGGIYSVNAPINDEDMMRIRAISNDVIVTDNFGSLLETDADTLVWTKEILDDKYDLQLWIQTLSRAITAGKNIYNLARIYITSDYAVLKAPAAAYKVEIFDASDPYRHRQLLPWVSTKTPRKAKTITVAGTYRRSGKFTTSQVIKKLLLNDGYKVGLIGTEPYSLLTGADDMVIPQVLPTWASAQSIYGAIRRLDKNKDLDVIIVGSQTGLSAPVIDSQGRAGAIGSAVITLGSQPDFLIMACSYDKLQELPTAIKLNELLTSKKVICVTFNRYNLSNAETLKSLEWIEKETGLPACDVLTQEEKLKDVIVSYLKSF